MFWKKACHLYENPWWVNKTQELHCHVDDYPTSSSSESLGHFFELMFALLYFSWNGWIVLLRGLGVFLCFFLFVCLSSVLFLSSDLLMTVLFESDSLWGIRNAWWSSVGSSSVLPVFLPANSISWLYFTDVLVQSTQN